MKNLNLERPLIVFDLETTGTDPSSDKIVEVSALRVDPSGDRESRTRRINPGRAIPPAATAIHGITDEDVRDAPSFRQVSRGLLDFIGDADLAGYNVLRFDIPLLDREFREAGLDFGVSGRRVVDAMTIYHRKERRDLTAAVRFFLGRDHEGAHSAEDDVAVTAEILEAQLERYDDLPRDVAALDAWVRNIRENSVDRSGKFVWENGEVVFAFGKHRGKSLRWAVEDERGYLDWILGSDFPEEAKQLVQRAMSGDYPASPGS